MTARDVNEFVDREFECLKIYFEENEWVELSMYEKQRFLTIKRNYGNLIDIGKITNILFFNLNFF